MGTTPVATSKSLKNMFRASLPVLDASSLAFLRMRIEGVDAVDAWLRFADDGSDGRAARRRLDRVIDDAALVARANSLEGSAAHFGQNMRELLARKDLDAIDGETARQRRTRLQRAGQRRQDLLDSVDQLSNLTPRDPRTPRLSDPVDVWFLGNPPEWLSSARVATLEDLGRLIRMEGFRWHRLVPHLGPEKASRICDWWQARGQFLGYLPTSSVLARRGAAEVVAKAAPALSVVPLERFALPADNRSGAAGTNRASRDRCQLQASNDYEAVQAWLSRKSEGSATWRAYRREAERVLLWAVLYQRKAMSSLTFEDCVAYREFMKAPHPEWVRHGKRQVERFSPQWRPFSGPLGTDSLKVAMVILQAMCQFLKDANYLESNPWVLVPRELPARDRTRDRVRSLPEPLWDRVEAWLGDELSNPPGPMTQRLRFIVRFAYTTGLRLSELAAARVGQLRTLDDAGDRFWMLQVIGKGGKERSVPVPESTIVMLRGYLLDRGQRNDVLETCSREERELPIIARAEDQRPLGEARIAQLLKDAFKRCAALIASTDPRGAALLLQASAHWLRHTYGTHATTRGVELPATMGNLGHASLATTSRYVTSHEAKRAREVQRAFDR